MNNRTENSRRKEKKKLTYDPHRSYGELALLSLCTTVLSVHSRLSILLIPSRTLRLSTCTALILQLSFFIHIIVSLLFLRTGTSNNSCKTLTHSSYKDLIAPASPSHLSPSYYTLSYLCPIRPKEIPSI